MKIDADSNGSVEWHEFMNYMLLENMTLSSMKQEVFEYIRPVPANREDKRVYDIGPSTEEFDSG